MQRISDQMTKMVHWSTQVGKFNTNYISKVEIALNYLDAMNIVVWKIHVNESVKKLRYNMILGYDILSELKIYLCLFKNTIKVNGGTYKGCKDPMKDVSKINLNLSSDSIKYRRFSN